MNAAQARRQLEQNGCALRLREDGVLLVSPAYLARKYQVFIAKHARGLKRLLDDGAEDRLHELAERTREEYPIRPNHAPEEGAQGDDCPF